MSSVGVCHADAYHVHSNVVLGGVPCQMIMTPDICGEGYLTVTSSFLWDCVVRAVVVIFSEPTDRVTPRLTVK
jgi:hypothetical protein